MPFTSFAKWAWSLNVTDFLHFKFPVLLSSSQKKTPTLVNIYFCIQVLTQFEATWWNQLGHMGSGIIIKATLLPFDRQEINCLENSPVQAPNICQLNPKLKINVSKHSLHILYLASTWFITHLTKWPSESVQLLVSLPLVAPWLRIGERTHAWCVSGLVQVSRCCMTQHPLQPPHPKDLVNSF